MCLFKDLTFNNLKILFSVFGKDCLKLLKKVQIIFHFKTFHFSTSKLPTFHFKTFHFSTSKLPTFHFKTFHFSTSKLPTFHFKTSHFPLQNFPLFHFKTFHFPLQNFPLQNSLLNDIEIVFDGTDKNGIVNGIDNLVCVVVNVMFLDIV